ncbi:MAG: hypothetical protein Q7U54_07500 [Bacteroidales bacterium]|nr:hypothetical protein [Bacteroidales bacterium]
MNKHFVKMTVLMCIATAVITSCNFTTEQKADTLEKAKANLEEASQDLNIARADSAEFANYKIESEKKLRENELLIADMKDRMKSERKETRVNYKMQLDSLDMQNTQLRNDMHFYSSQGKENWEKFKKEFNTELDALGKAISQLAERNMKKAS